MLVLRQVKLSCLLIFGSRGSGSGSNRPVPPDVAAAMAQAIRRARIRERTFESASAGRPHGWLFVTVVGMSKHEDSIDNVLDRLNHMREELVSLERSLERIQTAQSQDSSGEVPVNPKIKS